MMYKAIKSILVRLAGAGLLAVAFLFLSAAGAEAASVHITGTITDQNGAAVQNVSVTATNPGGTTVSFGPSLTATNGSYELDVDPGLYDIHFTPPGGSGFNPVVFSNLAAVNDQTLNVQFTPITHTISGILTDSNGTPLPSVNVVMQGNNDPSHDIGSVSTDVLGHYSMTVFPDVYGNIRLYGNDGSTSFTFSGTDPLVDLTSGDQTQNFQITTATLRITVKDANGNPMPGISVGAGGSGLASYTAGGPADVQATSSNGGTTDANGVANLTEIKGLTFPGGNISASVPGGGISADSDVVLSGDVANVLLQQQPSQPSTPTGLTAASPTSSAPVLTWNSAPSAVSYIIYRGEVQVGTSTNPNFIDHTLTASGSYSYTVAAVNSDGVSGPESAPFTVVYNNVPLTITAALSPAPNAAGWDNSNVTVTFTCIDSGSTVTSCTSPLTVKRQRANQTITGTAVDAAGNTATTSVTVNLDKTKPTITATPSPSANANGWNSGPVTITYACSDALSGVVSCPAPVTVSSEGANQSIIGTAVDAAGNMANVTSHVSIDTSNPTITAKITPKPNANGWNNTAPTVSFTCSDPLSGIASCTGPVTVTTDGANQVVTGTAVDNVGHTATTSTTVNLDQAVPTITATASPAANSSGWNNTPVTISFSCTDALSGVASCSDPVTLTGNGANKTVTGTVKDNAGNTATVSMTVNIDKTPPTVGTPTVSATQIPAPGPVTVTAAVSDNLSGIVGAEYYVDTDPGVGNGSVMALSGSNATASIQVNGAAGTTHTIGVRTRDLAGNWSIVKTVKVKISS